VLEDAPDVLSLGLLIQKERLGFTSWWPDAPKLYIPGFKSHIVLPVQDNVPLITDSLQVFASASLALPAVGADLVEDDGPDAEVPELRDKAALNAAEFNPFPGPEDQLQGEPEAARPAPAQAQAQAIDGAKQRNIANHNITQFPLLHVGSLSAEQATQSTSTSLTQQPVSQARLFRRSFAV
jgi:hypothetical protein